MVALGLAVNFALPTGLFPVVAALAADPATQPARAADSTDRALDAAANFEKIKQQQKQYLAQQLVDKALQEQDANE